MAKKYDESEGIWRTIGGRRVFIRTGQSLGDAMRESGKFPSYKKKKTEKISKEEYEKTPKDYKGTLKELISDQVEFQGEDGEKLIKKYKDLGYDIEKDKTIIDLTKEGTILKPVKIKEDIRGARGKAEKTLGSDVYEPKDAYKSYQEKMYKYSGTTTNEDGTLNYGQKSFSGKKYTNDEFMEHLEDGNWHTLHKEILDRKLTNDQVAYIKDNMNYGLWSFGDFKGLKRENYKTDAEYTNAIINEARTKRPEGRASLHYSTDDTAERIGTAKKTARELGYADANYKMFMKDKETKSIHTQSGSYTPTEIKKRDAEIKQMYKDTWDGKYSYMELNDKLENMRKHNKISQGELDGLKYDASIEHSKELAKELEKYDKIYHSNKSDVSTISKYQNMFNEYKKLHPNTKMDLQKFARMMMDLG